MREPVKIAPADRREMPNAGETARPGEGASSPNTSGRGGSSGRLPTILTRAAGRIASLYYRVDRRGPPVPSGPLLLAVNHPNSLLDPVLVYRCSERIARPLARAPLFDRLLLGPVLRVLGGIPIYRREDDPDSMHRNEEMFDSAVAVLHRGGAIQIYPEGRSHSGARLAEFRTGAARIALLAEARMQWRLDLAIVPVGITYSRKERARTHVAVRFGEPFGCRDLQERWADDPVAAARALTARIERGIRRQTLNFERHRDRILVEVAEQLYMQEWRRLPVRPHEPLGVRFPRLQRFARGMAWLRRRHPQEYDALVKALEEYMALSAELGVAEAHVLPRPSAGSALRYLLARGPALLFGLPLAVAGIALWAPATRLPGLVIRRRRPELELTATMALAALMAGSALAWLAWTVAAYLAAGPGVALGAALLAPLLGLVAIRWRDLARELRDDAVLIFRLWRHPVQRRRVALLRSGIVGAIGRLERLWQREERAGDEGLARPRDR